MCIRDSNGTVRHCPWFHASSVSHPHCCFQFSLPAFMEVLSLFEFLLCELCPVLRDRSFLYTVLVSYTHLDVYKRQFVCRAQVWSD